MQLDVVFPIGETIDETIAKLESLARDLRRIRAGLAPSRREVALAPLLSNWALGERAATCLIGRCHDHPIANGPVVQTSEIYALASDWTWVRTRSRLYRLGQPLGPVGQTSLN